MEKTNKILGLVLKILLIVLIGITTLLSLTMAYIMFAPDTFPKPFYLSYNYASDNPSLGTPGTGPASTETPIPKPTVEPGKGIMISTGSKIINLNDPTGRRYIRVTITLEFAPPQIDPKAKPASGGEGAAPVDPSTAFQTEITAKNPIIDDVIITTISQKKFDDLYTATGKESLRTEIMNQLNERLPEYQVISIYFTEFVVQ